MKYYDTMATAFSGNEYRKYYNTPDPFGYEAGLAGVAEHLSAGNLIPSKFVPLPKSQLTK